MSRFAGRAVDGHVRYEGSGRVSSTEGMDQLAFLECWFVEQCDDDWEHQYRIKLETLDNPGWALAVDLTGTNLQDHRIPWQRIDRSDSDWLHYWSDGARFEARCGAANLVEAIAAFRSFAEAC
jgi:immunity protein 53 of polymorphic toxin system